MNPTPADLAELLPRVIHQAFTYGELYLTEHEAATFAELCAGRSARAAIVRGGSMLELRQIPVRILPTIETSTP